jgi:hypothetical protein
MKLALLVFAVILLGIFITESAILFKVLSDLEAQMVLKSTPTVTNDPLWFKRVFRKTMIHNIESMELLWLKLPEEKTTIDIYTLEKLFRRLRQIPSDQKKRLKELVLHIPGLLDVPLDQNWARRNDKIVFPSKKNILEAIKNF